MKKISLPALGGLILILVLLPLFLSPYWTSLLFSLLINSALVGGMNFLWGFAGYLNLGYMAFFGLGAYGTAAMILKGASLASALLLVLLLSLPLAFLSSVLFFRLAGHYFSVATLGLLILCEELIGKLSFLSGGQEGLSLPLGYHLQESYWLALLLAVVSISLNFVLNNRKLGYQLKMIRDDESMAASIGIPLPYAKFKAHFLGVAIAMAAGGIYVYQSGYISPASAFGLSAAMPTVVMALIGGGPTWWGPVGGTFLVTGLQEWLWTGLDHWMLSFYGLVLLVVGLVRK